MTEPNYYQELHDFVLLVSEMRATQKAYFRNRDGINLQRSKKLEKEVDLALRRLEGFIGDQPTLF